MDLRHGYDVSLKELSESILQMGTLAASAVQRAVSAFETADAELASQVIQGDETIDQLEKSVEHQCLVLLLRQQPVASDLRKVSCAMKMITDIERIGDAAEDIAELSRHMNNQHPIPLMDTIQTMASCVNDMFQQVIEAYVKGDVESARQVIEKDDEADALFCEVRQQVIDTIVKQPQQADAAMNCFMVAKYLERVGDHAVNIGEWVEFSKTGVHKNSKIV